MSKSPFISKKKPSHKDMDYEFLREEGLKYIEKLGSKLWTDYNVHDPGITILEVLCYAITDLGYRTNFDIKDLLAEPEGSEKGSQFFTAKEILTCNPVTENDYRKILIDLNNVKNAWFEIARRAPSEPDIYGNCSESKLTFNPTNEKLLLNGLYKILVELDDELDPSDISTVNHVKSTVLNKFHQTRDLCEDFVDVDVIKLEEIGLCADIEVTPEANIEEVEAEIYFKVHQFLSPEVNFYSLDEMFGNGKTSEEIFEGPTLQNGFIDENELEQSALPEEIHVSDLYNIIMDIEGVKAIKKLLVVNYLNDIAQTSGEPWVLPLNPGHKPLLNLKRSSLTFYKGILPYEADDEEVKEKFEMLKMLDARSGVTDDKRDLPVPQGNYKNIEDYTSIHHEFPMVYGIGEERLPDSATELRKAQARQLKGYLMFYDQLLAGYLSQLAHVKDLLSVSNRVDATYFSQALYELPDVQELLKDFNGIDWDAFKADGNNDHIAKLLSFLEDTNTQYDRRNRFLNHLMARFGERFTDYTLLMYDIYGIKSRDDVIDDKEDFLETYPTISHDRGKAFNYKALNKTGEPDVWDTDNVSGLVAKVAKLTGIENYQRRSLACPSILQIKISRKRKPPNEGKFLIRVRDDQNKILLTGTKFYDSRKDARQEAALLEQLFYNETRYKINELSNKKYQLVILDDTNAELAISRELRDYDAARKLKDKILYLICPENECDNEGFHLVEHILLRPKNKNHTLFPVQVGCESCKEEFDPYSFRITVVVPYWPVRFKNRAFRSFFEQTVRMEAPAHLGVKICWVNCRQMLEFEKAYRAWLEENAKTQTEQDEEKLKDYANRLTDILFRLRNVYPQAYLFDCTQGENPISLGYTSLGQY